MQDAHRAIVELAALDKSDFLGVLRRILATDADTLEVERVNCWTFERTPLAIRCVLGFLRGPRTYESGQVIPQSAAPEYFRALAENPIILAHHARTDPRTREFGPGYLGPLGITSMMDVPIWVRGALWGVVCHEHVGPARRWTQAERDFALSIGHIVSMAVEARDRAEAERAAHFSELFMGVLGHDLRTPLTTIHASAQFLLRHGGNPLVLKEAERILRCAGSMKRMVEQLLDFTRIRLGAGLPIERRVTDVGEVCRRVVSDAELAHPGRPRAEPCIRGDCAGRWDPDRLWQVLSNLVGNAFEHGDSSGPVRVQVDGSDTQWVVVTVRSAGTIPADLVPDLFEPFKKGGAPGVGLGLGLFITREIVAAHGGTITCEQPPGETAFVIRLPRDGA